MEDRRRVGKGVREREKEREWWRDLAGFRRSIRHRASGNCLVCYCHYCSTHISPSSPLVSLPTRANLNLSCLSERVVGFCVRLTVCVCVCVSMYFFICPEMKLILQTGLCLHLPPCVAWGSGTLSLTTPQFPHIENLKWPSGVAEPCELLTVSHPRANLAECFHIETIKKWKYKAHLLFIFIFRLFIYFCLYLRPVAWFKKK